MRILFLSHAFNRLAQRLFVELRAAGHAISIEFDINDRVTEEAVALFRPDVVLAPFLKRAIPPSVWQHYRCLIVHPGILGDRGPSALDWAISCAQPTWGVSVLEARGEMDAGPVWATSRFAMREATKSSLYRNEVTDAAVVAVKDALSRIARGDPPLSASNVATTVEGKWHPLMRQGDRAIDWMRDDTRTILRKIRAADGFPGVRDEIDGTPCHLFGAHPEGALNASRTARPGTLIARREDAICRATIDGAIWITHLKRADTAAALKLPATMVLGDQLETLPRSNLAPQESVSFETWRDITYEERGAVGYLHFPFYNGAMHTAHCERLRCAYAYACNRATRVIVLMGGPDFWSNGINLNVIEASLHPAEESMRNIEAMDDLVHDIITTGHHLTIAALRGDAGAGGAFLALAGDRVYARSGVVLNPHYKGMGNLYGSEYWTYLLPRRVTDAQKRRDIIENRLPVGAAQAAALGLVDAHFGTSVAAFEQEIAQRAQTLAQSPDFAAMLAAKRAQRAHDEGAKPLAAYREEELARMKLNFFGFDPSYHVARYHFVAKVPRSRTPLHLALHRRRGRATPRADNALSM